jgi:hypothetical protein
MATAVMTKERRIANLDNYNFSLEINYYYGTIDDDDDDDDDGIICEVLSGEGGIGDTECDGRGVNERAIEHNIGDDGKHDAEYDGGGDGEGEGEYDTN